MKLKLTRWLIPSFIAIILTLVIVTPCLAIDEPDDLQIRGVWVYRNARETGDQMYIISYCINYTTNPDEDVTNAYLFRLMNVGVELAHTYPVAYFNDGYGDGVAAIYFDSDEAPAWDGNYTMRLVGNPFLTWNASVPSFNYTPFDVWQDNEIAVTRVILGARILDLAEDLETSWNVTLIGTSDTGEEVLNNYAGAYFIYAVPYIYEIAANIFATDTGLVSDIIQPEVPEERDMTGHALNLTALIIGTPFDFTALADDWGVPRGPLTAMLYYGIVAFVLVIVARRLGSYKPVMMLSIPFVILGAFLGVPLIATILAGLAALTLVAYTIFYKQSTA